MRYDNESPVLVPGFIRGLIKKMQFKKLIKLTDDFSVDIVEQLVKCAQDIDRDRGKRATERIDLVLALLVAQHMHKDARKDLAIEIQVKALNGPLQSEARRITREAALARIAEESVSAPIENTKDEEK